MPGSFKLADRVELILKTKGNGQLWSISPEATVYDAVAHMAEKSVGALVVLDDLRLVGIISERDYARKVILAGRSSQDTRVAEIMSAPVTTVTPMHTVDECMAMMTELRIRHLPVVEDDEVLGMISIGDLVKWIITEQGEAIQQLESYIANAYPR
jgi:signal-transduction protein with cAMP-binding, CBS, and nucleotidyltransferase domain